MDRGGESVVTVDGADQWECTMRKVLVHNGKCPGGDGQWEGSRCW
jgi:hypothetical protein